MLVCAWEMAFNGENGEKWYQNLDLDLMANILVTRFQI